MKKILTILLLVLVFAKTHSQIVFCPPGAEWHYFYGQVFSSGYNEQIKYVGDSLAGNETIKVLKHTRYFKKQNFGGDKYTRIKQRGDTIFMRSLATQDAWQILYNFAAQPRQGWINKISTFKPSTGTLPATPIVSYTVVVDSVSSVIINGFILKRLYVKYKNSQQISIPASESITIDERIGGNQFLFNFYNVNLGTDNDYFLSNLCYSDDVFGIKQFIDVACYFHGDVGIVESEFQMSNIKIYPNPTRDFVSISSENEQIGECTVSIKDLCGWELKQVIVNNLNSEPLKVDIADLAKGVYILSISNKWKIIFNGKLLKSE